MDIIIPINMQIYGILYYQNQIEQNIMNTVLDVINQNNTPQDKIEVPNASIPTTEIKKDNIPAAVEPVVEDTKEPQLRFELSDEDKASIDDFEKTLVPESKEPNAIPLEKQATIELPESIKNELESLRGQSKVLENPIVKSIAELINSGGDITSLFIQQGKDYAKSSPDEVLNDYMSDIYGETEKDKIPVAISDFKKKYTSDFEIRREIASMRDVLSKKYPSNQNAAFQEKLGSALEKVKQTSAQRLSEQNEIQQSARESYTVASKKITETKDFYGISLSDEDKSKILEMTRYTTPLEGKKFNADKGVEVAIKAYMYDKAIIEAKKNGAREFAQYRARINKQGASPIPGAKQGVSNSVLESIINQDKK
jgi:hypothetical protein